MGSGNVTQINDITKSANTRDYVEQGSRRCGLSSFIGCGCSNNSGRLSRGSFPSDIKPRVVRDRRTRVRVGRVRAMPLPRYVSNGILHWRYS